MTDVVERYLRLGLRLDRHAEGTVDAYFGPPELAAAVESEPPADPRELLAEAEALLGELDDGWLRDQAAGLRTYAAALAGEPLPYADEVEGCYGIRPRHIDEAVFEAAHERLDLLLPGDGPLAARYEHWRESTRVPAERVERIVAAVVEERGRHAGVPGALGALRPRARRARRPLPHRADVADVHPHVCRRTGALPRVRRRRPGALPPAADRAGARRRSRRGVRGHERGRPVGRLSFVAEAACRCGFCSRM